MSQTRNKKQKKHVVIDTKDLLGGIQALTIFYEEKVEAFTQIKAQYGDDHPATQAMFDEIETLGNIVNFFTGLTGTQLKGEGEHFN